MTMQYNPSVPFPEPVKYLDDMGFWDGVQKKQLSFQKCKECGTLAHPPRPMCPKCHSFEKEWVASQGKGKVYSWVTYREPNHGAFKTPYSVVLVEMDEGVRVVANVVGMKPEDIKIGMPVEVVFEDVAPGITIPKFKKVG